MNAYENMTNANIRIQNFPLSKTSIEYYLNKLMPHISDDVCER